MKNIFVISYDCDNLGDYFKKCNEDLPLEELCTIYEVDYAIEASNLTKEDVMAVAESYRIWGNNIKEPTFYISNVEINEVKKEAVNG